MGRYAFILCPFFLHCPIVIVTGSGGEVDRAMDMTIDRVKQTLLGVIEFLLISNILFPVSARNIALWNLIDALTQLRSATKNTLFAFTSFVHTEAELFRQSRHGKDPRKIDESKRPCHQQVQNCESELLLHCDVAIARFPEIVKDATSEPALWRIPFGLISPLYSDLIACAKRAGSAVRLIYHCVVALHYQANLREMKRSHAASIPVPSKNCDGSLHTALLIDEPTGISDRRVALSTFAYDTTSCLSRGFLAFEPLMKVTEDLSAHIDSVLEVRALIPLNKIAHPKLTHLRTLIISNH